MPHNIRWMYPKDMIFIVGLHLAVIGIGMTAAIVLPRLMSWFGE
jgi:hypothetical protein